MIDPSTRLRRAIVLNDLHLVKRIVRNNPTYLQNPDLLDKSNTSLHLAAKLGYLSIVRFLVESGHEAHGISRNATYDTPLLVAADAQKLDVGTYLIEAFPHSVPYTNASGHDALILAARHGTVPLLYALLESSVPADPNAYDVDGNTALHHASAAGELKALRVLLQYGASPLALNLFSWTPIAYSATAAAESYFKQLVAEFEKRRAEMAQREHQHQQQQQQQRGGMKAGGVRLVTQELEGPLPPVPLVMGNAEGGRMSGESVRSPVLNSPISDIPGNRGGVIDVPGNRGGVVVRRGEEVGSAMDWSPVESRSMTPTMEGRGPWPFGTRSRAQSREEDR